MPEDGRIGICWAVILLLLTGAVLLAPRPRTPRIPHQRAEAWMAQSLPGVGPVTAEDMAAAIRDGQRDALPASARPAARACFRWDDDPDLGDAADSDRMSP